MLAGTKYKLGKALYCVGGMLGEVVGQGGNNLVELSGDGCRKAIWGMALLS